MNTKGLALIGLSGSLAILLTVVFLFILPQPASGSAGIRYVAPGGICGIATPCYSTVQAAVNAAVAGDEIRIAAGMYPIQVGDNQVVSVNKSLVFKGGYTNVNWDTPDPDINQTVLNALTQGRVMMISGATNVTIEGLRLVFGSSSSLGSGGGIYIEEATVTINHTWVTSNTAPTADTGGGIYLKDAIVVINSSTIRSNAAGAGGGLRILNSQVTIQDSLIEKNVALHATSPAGGGGLLIGGVSQVSMSANTIRDNAAAPASYGGGISLVDNNSGYNGNMKLFLFNNRIEGNEAGVGGGVRIANNTVDNLWVNATVISNTIHDNYCRRSGAGISASANVTITYNLILNNHAGVEKATGFVNYGSGGGLAVSGQALIEHNTIQFNEAKGIAGDGLGGGAILRGNNSILFRNNIVNDNRAYGVLGGRGGGLYVIEDGVVIEENYIQRNSATGGSAYFGGGGVAIEGDAILKNNIVTNNSVGGTVTHGSGISVYGCQPTLVHTTIADNTGGAGEGIYVLASGNPGQPVLYNTIVATQTVGVRVDSGSAQNLATLYGVLWWNNGSNTIGTAFAFDEETGDPDFVNPAGYDYHIGAGSAAIDEAVPTTLAVDIDWEPRFPGHVDLGADEYWAPGVIRHVYLPLVVK